MAQLKDLKKMIKDLDIDDKLEELKDIIDADDDGEITDDIKDKVNALKKKGVDVEGMLKKLGK